MCFRGQFLLSEFSLVQGGDGVSIFVFGLGILKIFRFLKL